MSKFFQSRLLVVALWVACVALVSVGGYFAGLRAEAKFEDVNTDHTPPPEVKLEEQGRYDEAIQAVLDQGKKWQRPEADTDSHVALVYLEWAKKDLVNREQRAQQAASYLERAAALAPKDPFILESAMNSFDRVGDYSQEGCSDYEKSVGFGETALTLLPGTTVTVEGYAGNYPTQPIKDDIERSLKRIREKVAAWCGKAQ